MLIVLLQEQGIVLSTAFRSWMIICLTVNFIVCLYNIWIYYLLIKTQNYIVYIFYHYKGHNWQNLANGSVCDLHNFN
jgi:hypothetical protein